MKDEHSQEISVKSTVVWVDVSFGWPSDGNEVWGASKPNIPQLKANVTCPAQENNAIKKKTTPKFLDIGM